MDPLPPYWPLRCSNPAASAIDPLLLGKPGLLTAKATLPGPALLREYGGLLSSWASGHSWCA